MNKPSSWAELKAYHGVMPSTFHPAEEGKPEPINTRSAVLTAALDKLIKGTKATDTDITATLTKVRR